MEARMCRASSKAPVALAAGLLFCLLSLAAYATEEDAIMDPDEVIEWDIPRLPLQEAISRLGHDGNVSFTANFAGANPVVGPIRGLYSRRQVWQLFLDAGCLEGGVRSAGRLYEADPIKIPGLTDQMREYDLPRATLLDTINLL